LLKGKKSMKNSTIKNITFLTLIFFLIFVDGCGTVKVPIKVTHPAEINMYEFKQIAISNISGNIGQIFSDGLKNRLVESNRFKVVDRNRMNQILKELKLSQSDLTDSKNTIKLGKLMTASALITGHMEGKYKENISNRRGTCYKDKKPYSCTTYYREGIFYTSGSIDVIDIQTGEIIRSKVLNANNKITTSAINATPNYIDKDSLARAANLDNLMNFMKAITPWDEMVLVPFKKDGNIPDLEQGINQARIGELFEAIKIFQFAAKAAEENAKIKPSSISNAYWNLGLAYEYSYDYDNAIIAFKKAYALDPRDEYIKEINNANKLKAEKKKLDKQVGDSNRESPLKTSEPEVFKVKFKKSLHKIFDKIFK
jgi:tetratricopeptide (TPR) repeat protein